MLPLLALLFACSTEPAPAEAAPTVEQTLLAVRNGLSEAHRRWSAGANAEAKALVLSTYREHFERLEPELRKLDAQQTLELEYAFAVLANHLGKKGSPVEIAAEVRGLSGRVEAAASQIPRAPGAPPEPEKPQTPATTSVPVAPERGADAPGVSSAKPEED